MTTQQHRESAKIYEFPVGGRSGRNVNRDTARSTVEAAPVRVPKIEVGSSWYHGAAVAEELALNKR
jgi:uncharacterized protein DUF2735